MTPYRTPTFKQRAAKALLADWLQTAEIQDDHATCAGLEWRRNYGVFVDLEFHETSDPFYFESSQGLNPGADRDRTPPLDWFDPDAFRGPMLFCPSITIFHKGAARYLIEVVDGERTPPEKIAAVENFFSHSPVDYREIEAEEILRLRRVPADLDWRLLTNNH